MIPATLLTSKGLVLRWLVMAGMVAANKAPVCIRRRAIHNCVGKLASWAAKTPKPL